MSQTTPRSFLRHPSHLPKHLPGKCAAKSCGGAAPVSLMASSPAGSRHSGAMRHRVTQRLCMASQPVSPGDNLVPTYQKNPLKPISKSQNISPPSATGSSRGAASPPRLQLLPASSGSCRQQQDGIFSRQCPRRLPGWCGAGRPRHTYAHRTLDKPPAESLLQNHPLCAAARSFWFHRAAATLRVPAPSCLLTLSSLGGIFFPSCTTGGIHICQASIQPAAQCEDSAD